jgi:hypothetical protein
MPHFQAIFYHFPGPVALTSEKGIRDFIKVQYSYKKFIISYNKLLLEWLGNMRSCDIIPSIATGLLAVQPANNSIYGKGNRFSLFQSIQTGFGAHSAFCSMGERGHLHRR